MNVVKLKCELRPIKGKIFLKKIRAMGKLPAVIYGKNTKETINLSLDKPLIEKILKEGKAKDKNIIISLKEKEIAVKICAISVHPISGELEHVDFLTQSEANISSS